MNYRKIHSFFSRSVIFLLSSLLVTVLNPSHWNAVFSSFSHKMFGAGKFSDVITEYWNPWKYYLQNGNSLGFICFALFILVAVICTVCFRKNYNFPEFATFLMLLITGIMAWRFTFFLALFSGILICKSLSSLFDKNLKFARRISILTLGIYVSFFTLSYMSKPDIEAVQIYKESGVTSFLSQAKLELPIYTPYEWGGHLMWKLYPKYKTFVDSRTMDFRLFTDYRNAHEGFEEEVFFKNGIRTVAWYITNPDTQTIPRLVSKLLTTKNWHLIYFDDFTVVFTRDAGGFKEIDKKSFFNHQIKRFQNLAFMTSTLHSYLVLGELNVLSGNFTEAIKAFSAAERLFPGNESSREWLKILNIR